MFSKVAPRFSDQFSRQAVRHIITDSDMIHLDSKIKKINQIHDIKKMESLQPPRIEYCNKAELISFSNRVDKIKKIRSAITTGGEELKDAAFGLAVMSANDIIDIHGPESNTNTISEYINIVKSYVEYRLKTINYDKCKKYFPYFYFGELPLFLASTYCINSAFSLGYIGMTFISMPLSFVACFYARIVFKEHQMERRVVKIRSEVNIDASKFTSHIEYLASVNELHRFINRQPSLISQIEKYNSDLCVEMLLKSTNVDTIMHTSQSPSMCRAAVIGWPESIRNIKVQTVELAELAVSKDASLIKFIDSNIIADSSILQRMV